MTIFNILSLAGAMFLLAIIPGTGVFITISRALASGFKNASLVVAGIVLGDLVFLLLAIYGLSTMAEILGELFVVVKYLGGVCLIWMGYKIWIERQKNINLEGVAELSWKSNFFSGLAITFGNPKVILFYLGFLPTFVNLRALSKFDVLILVLVVSIVLGGVMLTHAYFGASVKRLFKDEKINRRKNCIAGGAMMAIGTVLIIKA
ncbi:Lysine exporter protein [Bathymodiolus thermophilus thioautotrophic gill symbiont]|uniref:Lysine exporter protein n=1 Tax=Bathymodiolus thermophilus thioautotrophic gill symbiont TaxID=2360 RepID=A0A3G3ILH0_9GAMM|nr:LysE family translocator [Bathymodiolus thermophilus thioautotrophic gill symbiont]AYQ56686.1 Lysine exporter protein [Bathymodiolus thermophilus thioautotrophic gill symbiont]